MSLIDVQKSKELYNSDVYLKNTDMWEDSTGVPRAIALADVLDKAGIKSEIKSWLDVGCGSGGVIRYISNKKILKNCTEILGVDISSNAIEIANKLYPNARDFYVKFELIAGDDKQKFGIENYSLISMIHVLEHVPDMIEFIKIYGGNAKYIYINVPIEFNFNYVIRKGVLAELYKKYGHLHFFDEGFIDELLISNGYEIVRKTYSLDYKGRRSSGGRLLINIFRNITRFVFGDAFANYAFSGFSYGLLLKSKK